MFKETMKRLNKIKDDKVNSFNSISLEFSSLLKENKINAQIIGREKTPFSIALTPTWRLMLSGELQIE